MKVWERTFQRVYELANIPEHKAFVHNFRHSFATDLLTQGIPIEDVAALLGNSGDGLHCFDGSGHNTATFMN